MNIYLACVSALYFLVTSSCAGALKNPERFSDAATNAPPVINNPPVVDAATTTPPQDSGMNNNGTLPNAACAQTAQQVETSILIPKCGISGCHNAGGPNVDFQTPGIAARMLPAGTSIKGKTSCAANDLFDKANPANSFFIPKSNDATVTCGTPMSPFSSATDKPCLAEWAKYVAGGGT